MAKQRQTKKYLDEHEWMTLNDKEATARDLSKYGMTVTRTDENGVSTRKRPIIQGERVE